MFKVEKEEREERRKELVVDNQRRRREIERTREEIKFMEQIWPKK